MRYKYDRFLYIIHTPSYIFQIFFFINLIYMLHCISFYSFFFSLIFIFFKFMQKGNFLYEISFLFFYYIYLSSLFLSYLHKQQNISCILLTHPYTDISITSRIFPFLPNDFYIISTHLHYFHFLFFADSYAF